jgi:AcrR family transcriptional regulator
VTPRTGRRPGKSGAREAILDAARENFAALGFASTSVRRIAQDADVDAALVHHYFGTKQQLFVAAMELPINPLDIIQRELTGPRDEMGARLIRTFLTVWDTEPTSSRGKALLRSAMLHEQSAAMLREFIGMIVGEVTRTVDIPDAHIRAPLVASQLLGLALLRYVIEVEPIASMDADTLIAAVAPNLQRYLAGTLDGGAV